MQARREQSPIDWGAVSRGASVGLAVIVPVTIVRAVLERDLTDLSHSAWIYPLSALILVAYALAGAVAAWTAPGGALRHGALAGVAAVVVWIPVRIVIWAVRESGRGLVSGDRAALPPGQVLGALGLGGLLGMGGAAVAARLRGRDGRVSALQRGA
jgi:hypothetical protein